MSPQNEDCKYEIVDVWAHNLEKEMINISNVIEKYPYVAMDTEFPGVVARPVGNFRSTADYHFQTVRCNVDLLKLIQLGLTFCDEEGNFPKEVSTWQFNFRFSLVEDMYAQDSIDMLARSGINFEKHDAEGIELEVFAEYFMTSGVILSDDVKWISFHSGYDFGYLLKGVMNANLPSEETDFFDLLQTYFNVVYDIKYLMKSCRNLKGGLQDVADELQVRRVGPQHQAGSDSLLTAATFFRMRNVFFEDNIDDSKYCGHLYGLGTTLQPSGSTSTTAGS
eukprot:Nk52_evm5s301 gene=Nk52_evmTU5s301